MLRLAGPGRAAGHLGLLGDEAFVAGIESRARERAVLLEVPWPRARAARRPRRGVAALRRRVLARRRARAAARRATARADERARGRLTRRIGEPAEPARRANPCFRRTPGLIDGLV